MTETRRTILLRMGWFPPDTSLLGQPVRPVCFATWHAMKLMGLSLLDRDAVLDPRDEYAQLMVYLWLHREPPSVIADALWSGSWRVILEEALPDTKEPPMALLNLWREEREQILSLIEAAEVKIRPRPRTGNNDTPFEVVGPDEMAHQISVVRRAHNATTEHVLWNIPFYQFCQDYHAEMRWQAHWTVRARGGAPPATAEDFEGFGASVLANLQAQMDEEAAEKEELERELNKEIADA